MKIPISGSNPKNNPDNWKEGSSPEKAWRNWFAWFPILGVDTADNKMKIVWLETAQVRTFISPLNNEWFNDDATVYRALPDHQ